MDGKCSEDCYVRKKMGIIGRVSWRMNECGVHIVFACKICGFICVKRVLKYQSMEFCKIREGNNLSSIYLSMDTEFAG